MRINVSTIFQVLVLIAQDVLAFEAKQQIGSSNPSVTTPETQATDNQPPA